LLLICLAFSATDLFGSVSVDEEDDEDTELGFPEYARKSLLVDGVYERIAPYGLPILINGQRVEFRGLALNHLNLEQLTKALPILAKVFNSLAEYSKTQTGDWQDIRAKLMGIMAEAAFPSVHSDTHNPLVAYLFMMQEYAAFSLIEGKNAATDDEYVQLKERLLRLALQDPTFMNSIAHLGYMPQGDELLDRIRQYYAENDWYEDEDGDQVQVKTWERMRWRVASRGVTDPAFRQAIMDILTGEK
jgi:hypothetical protein